ncbi:MAG: 3,4-dihydroxy-2-butanone-4-phosphate synthase [Flavobacteriales bacterium]|jgi:3,4-dihydroxy 2-butanone 4-phosphate synthase/GTP cyclohydrolase II|nr:3,4-dihydroxy-2-butanone-4-phosphate synthase [Flavobacteriales bacterium]|tara:strand:+ start:12796 stop:13905 length:1110 start_codon:yes stop_codon:yes gene_type:complete
MSLNTIEEALTDIANGKVVIVVDDENRENEGDFVAAAECVTPEMINFMAKEGRGLICTPILPKRSEELDLPPMVQTNTDPNKTAFTVSIDRIGEGCTTGISAYDRYMTVKALVDPKIKPEQLARPGHIFPLIAKPGGVLRRVGHTEAAVDLARLAGKAPAGVIVEIMNEDGTMARLPQLKKIAVKHALKIISIEDLVAFRMEKESLVELAEKAEIDTPFGKFTLHAFEQKTNEQVHIALTKGEWKSDEIIPVRIQSAGIANDVFHALTSNEASNFRRALSTISKRGNGAIIYMNQERSSNKIINRIRQFKKDGSLISLGSMKDAKDFGIGAQIIHQLGIKKIDLITNNPIKRVGVAGYGLEIVKNSALE